MIAKIVQWYNDSIDHKPSDASMQQLITWYTDNDKLTDDQFMKIVEELANRVRAKQEKAA